MGVGQSVWQMKSEKLPVGIAMSDSYTSFMSTPVGSNAQRTFARSATDAEFRQRFIAHRQDRKERVKQNSSLELRQQNANHKNLKAS